MSHLVLSLKYEIYHLHKQGESYSSIAKKIRVHRTTVSRELKRNSDKRNKVYKVNLAQKKAEERHRNKSKHKTFTQGIK